MALINCPECNKSVSDKAESCPECGYPIKNYVEEQKQVEYLNYLTSKIKPCEFTVPEERAKVCIRCGDTFSLTGHPYCDCGMPSVEVDYPIQQTGSSRSIKYIMLNCVLPRNIGDPDCKEFQERLEVCMNSPEIEDFPPNPKYFGAGYRPTNFSYTPPKPNIPTCPICQSTNLTKISTAKKAGKIALFGIFGAGDVGKTYKCNKCGSKF